MARIEDVKDPALREKLAESERLIDADSYREAIERCAEAYLLIMQQHPELVPKIPAGWDGLGPPPGGGGVPGGPTAVWPMTVGVRILFNEAREPTVSFDKQRYNYSEAVTVLEFSLDLATRAGRA